MLPTVLAGDCTAATERRVAVMTIVAVVFIHGTAAIRARDALPVVQFHIGAAPAVGMEQLGNQNEEVMQAALSQGCPDGRAAFSFAKLFILDVGMGDVVASGRRVWVQRHDAIGGCGAQRRQSSLISNRPNVM